MIELDPRRDSRRKMTIAVAAALALGAATMATGTMAFGRGGGGGGGHFGGGGGGHFGGGFGGGHFGGGGRFAGRFGGGHFGRGFRGGFGGLYGFGGALIALLRLRLRQLLRPHALRLRLGLQLKSVVSFGGASLIGLICK
jgi:hypothetical protein